VLLICFYSSLHSGEGRSLSLEDWQQMRTDVAKLHKQLDRIDFAWIEDDQKDSNATTTILNSDAGNKTAAGGSTAEAFGHSPDSLARGL
jgi:hypothetical protein